MTGNAVFPPIQTRAHPEWHKVASPSSHIRLFVLTVVIAYLNTLQTKSVAPRSSTPPANMYRRKAAALLAENARLREQIARLEDDVNWAAEYEPNFSDSSSDEDDDDDMELLNESPVDVSVSQIYLISELIIVERK